jgi:hypothetical protein
MGSNAMATERPTFKVIHQFETFEVREYPPQLVAETTVDGDRDEASSAGFRKLAGYIFGGNRTNTSVAMTSPVTQTKSQRIEMTAPVTQVLTEGNRWVIQFIMPSSFSSLTQLPIPNDTTVTLREVPKRTVAVVTYSGVWSEALYAKQLDVLREGLAKQGLSTLGPAMFARYDPPWKPWFLRTNEIMLEVAPLN